MSLLYESIKAHQDSVVYRFWAKVDKSGPVPPTFTTPCWVWTASTANKGYGQLSITKSTGGSRPELAHRVSWVLMHGDIPEGLCVLHKCDNPPCVNAESHLFLGTQASNTADMLAKGRVFRGGSVRGELHGRHKLTAEQVVEIRRLAALDELNYREIGDLFSVGRSEISHIMRGKLWKQPKEAKT